ncbi:PQQ-dependent sugar dehydrogenase [Singulisphaera sp. PoT]|uniref:PQQ-dependent sugar dehydrogenase n=1 Tax=Singulisphaera sp. PoT TaxID=3411797 RepID=UPI003BF4E98A
MRLEPLESRLTPTTLPSGFGEAVAATGLTEPTSMEFSPDGRLFVLEQTGNVELVRDDGTTWTALHLNVDSQGERGLLGIAFDPNYASNHYVYLYYTNPNAGAASWSTGEHNQLSRFTVNDSNPQQPVFTNEAPILDWNSLSSATNHNGGAILFGADGMLYAGAGDNLQTFTQGGNTYRASQTLGNLLGKQLRIDVSAFNSGEATRDDTTVGHLIPSDNPFVGSATGINQLIYAIGLRNPYTFAVQPGTGKIFINDVGEVTWEEINLSVAGANYGWSGGNTDGFGQSPPGPGVYHNPLLAYNHSGGPANGGSAITGGTFYNPSTAQFPGSYVGKYFYGDIGGNWIRVFDPAHPGTASNPDTSASFATGITGGVVDVAVDSSGHLFYLTYDGKVTEVSYNAPKILTQPTSLTVNQGDAATFQISASGASLTYQWQHLVGANWVDVGTNSPRLTIVDATSANAGAYRAIAANAFGAAISANATLTVQVPTTPTLLQGLKGEYFDFTTRLRSLPDLTGRTPDLTRVESSLNFFPSRLAWAGLDARFNTNFAARFTGFLKVDTPGRYTLALNSNDGSRVWIDGNLVINNNGIHGMVRRTRAITLDAGLHSIQVDYFQNRGPAGLILSWSGPGVARQAIPASQLFHASDSTQARSVITAQSTSTEDRPQVVGSPWAELAQRRRFAKWNG